MTTTLMYFCNAMSIATQNVHTTEVLFASAVGGLATYSSQFLTELRVAVMKGRVGVAVETLIVHALAEDDVHALSILRDIVATLNRRKHVDLDVQPPQEVARRCHAIGSTRPPVVDRRRPRCGQWCGAGARVTRADARAAYFTWQLRQNAALLSCQLLSALRTLW